MILKYLSEVPSYEKISEEEFAIREEMENTLTEYLDTIYLDKFSPDSIESQFPLIERGQEILTITPMESRDRIWNYIDNIKSLKTRRGYELEFGKATYIDLTLTSGEIVELGANDLVYLLNDNGKTIETLCRAKVVRYNKEKADILRKYVLKEYTKEEMIEALNDMYSKEISNKELMINSN